jgi:hypothetical protein
MDSLLLPDDAIAVLRRAVWQPDAKRSYELMTGSFWWPDELVHEVSRLCVERDNWSFRYLMGYRASVIRGAPQEAYRPVWEQVARECPDWPGLRPERNSPALAVELHREGRRQCVEFSRLERRLRRKAEEADHTAAPDRPRD